MKNTAKKIWKRELAFKAVRLFEKNDMPGAWRLRALFESLVFYEDKKQTVICATEDNVNIVIEPFDDNGVEASIFKTGTYERGTLHVMKTILKPGDRFIDIGANVGLMSLTAAKLVGEKGSVDSFEPVPEIRQLLQYSIKENNFNNINVHSIGLGSKPSTMTIHRHLEVNRGCASLAYASVEKNTVSIGIDTLENVITNSSIKPIKMIKIDVEGWEFEVLKGALKIIDQIPKPVFCIEFSQLHPLEGGTHFEMFDYLCVHGYCPYRLNKSKDAISTLIPVSSDNIPEHDNLFFFPESQLKTFDQQLFDTSAATIEKTSTSSQAAVNKHHG